MQDQHNDAASIATPTGSTSIEIQPVTLERWDDLVALFETSPVTSSCWCMSPRVRASEFSRFGAAARQRNREMMHDLVAAGMVPGLLAYVDGRPVGWISVGPQEEFVRLRRSRATVPPADGRPVWLIVCFYTLRAYRRQGITRSLVQAAVQHAAAHRAAALEAFPVARWGETMLSGHAYTGTASTFRELGFYEVGLSGRARGEPRIIMRYDLPSSRC
jgi:GNAT superfamily N-acetyltransferase